MTRQHEESTFEFDGGVLRAPEDPSLGQYDEPQTLYIRFAGNGNIRKWQREPFEGASKFVAASQ